ncbi:hypothetical protein ACWDXD_24950 [Streptomyces sp. NPDC003314]
MANRGKTGEAEGLSAAAVALYERLLHGDTQVKGEPGLEELIQNDLAAEDYWRRDGHHLGLPVASSRRQKHDLAFAAIAAIIDDVQRHETILSTIPANSATEPDIEAGGVRFLANPEECSAALLQALRGMTHSMWSAQPVDRTPETLEKSLAQDIERLEQGIEYRTIFLDTARQKPHQVKWADAITEHGGEVRTLPGDFHRAVIIDGRAVMISDHRPGPGYLSRFSGWFITHPGMVGLIIDVYKEQWNRAKTWKSPQIRNAETAELTPIQLKILRAKANGATRDSIARELGTSPRTISSQLSSICELLDIPPGFEFQLGMAYERLRQRLEGETEGTERSEAPSTPRSFSPN